MRVRRAAALAAVCALAAVPAYAQVSKKAAVGKPAPRFVLEQPSGGQLTREAFAGRPLLVNVFASWCPPCRLELPRLVRAHERYGKRVAFLGVDEQEGAVTATSFAKRMRVTYPIALDDGPFAAGYGASSIPETIFIDARGVVRGIWRGPISDGALERGLERLTAEGR